MTKLCVFIIILINFQTVFSSTDYLMQITNTQALNDSTVSFEVYINGKDSTFELTSYQCALCIENNIPVYGFSYMEGTSDFKSISPSVGLGINNSNGETKLTFASLPGSEIISTNKVRIGTFIIKTKITQNDSMPEIEWCFEYKIGTILTGAAFDNITNIQNHSSQSRGKLPIINIIASSTDPSSSTSYLTDGKLYDNGDPEAKWKTYSIPAYLIFDLGESKNISQTKFSFYNFQNGRKYTYSIYVADDTSNWSEVVSDVISAPEEWTINNFNSITARFVKLYISANNENNIATLWEAEIYGVIDISDTINGVTNNNKEPLAPKEFVLSQNYPNPFNPSTKINFALAEPGKVSLEVYNILGEKVTTLVNQEMTDGSHEVNFNASNFASGIYIYRLNVNDKFVDTKKMILMK